MNVKINPPSMEEAANTVIRQLGIVHLSKDSMVISQTKLPTDTVPFIGDSVTGKMAWRVQIRDFKCGKHFNDSSFQNKDLASLDVILCPQTGHVLYLKLYKASADLEDSSPISINDETQHLKACDTRYTGFPQIPPKFTLVEVLKKSHHWGSDVKVLSAHYIIESQSQRKPTPVWVLYMKGLTSKSLPLPLLPCGKKEIAPYSVIIRTVFDAKTGNLMYFGNVPRRSEVRK